MATQAEVADHIDLTDKQVRNLMKSGVIPGTKGRGGYDIDACRLSYIRYLRSINNKQVKPETDKDLPDDLYDYDFERARLTYHQANIASLDENIKKEKLIPAEAIEAAWMELVTAFRSKILSLPTKAAHHFITLTDINQIQDCLKEHLYEALEELSNFESDQYGIESETECLSYRRTAAKSECFTMGR